MQYAMDRFAALDKTVSELTDSSLPSGETGRLLRERWLRPARADLSVGRGRLQDLQRAVAAGDAGRAGQMFALAREVGRAGVDVGLLTRTSLRDCARLFAAPASAPPRLSIRRGFCERWHRNRGKLAFRLRTVTA